MSKPSPLPKPLFTSARDAAAAFYEALARADLDAMMAVWSEDEDVVCIHPGGPRLQGLAAVREAWREMFAGNPKLSIRIMHGVSQTNMMVEVHNVLEFVSLEGDDQLHPPMIATNVFMRGADGWRMVLHHASPSPDERSLLTQDSSRVVH